MVKALLLALKIKEVFLMLSTESIKIEINVPSRLRDGTILYSDVYRPEAHGCYPAIITRLPYNKNIEFPSGTNAYMDPVAFARAGYAVVIQDVRGTGSSEGDAAYWQQEVEDSYDSVEAIAAEPWCDGNVGMFGYSYFGYTQWAAAVAQPPHLKTICPGFTDTEFHRFPFTIRGDKLKLRTHYYWTVFMSLLGMLRSKKSPGQIKAVTDRLIYLNDHLDELVYFLPLKDSEVIKTVDDLGMVPRFYDLLTHTEDFKFWEKTGGQLPLDKVTIPVFHIVGWFDIDFCPAIINNYLELERLGALAGKKLKQKLIIGPWVHTGEMPSKTGEMQFGGSASGAMDNIIGRQISWFDHWLKGKNNSIEEEPPVHIFIMGENRWREENEWPLARTQYCEYYFHSHGCANTLSGDGSLSETPPGEEPFDGYLYDPRNPVKTHKMGTGCYDQREVESRSDVLVYSTEPLTANLEVTGPVKVKLWASTSAVDTDFTAKLVDVFPDGRAFNMAEGIIRAGYQPKIGLKALTPGKIYEYKIDLGPTSNVFQAGHRIRVEISSSDFPKWDRNLNTGAPLGVGTEIKTAMQNVFHQRQFASHIVLPVI
jgi:uncharacterized protein